MSILLRVVCWKFPMMVLIGRWERVKTGFGFFQMIHTVVVIQRPDGSNNKIRRDRHTWKPIFTGNLVMNIIEHGEVCSASYGPVYQLETITRFPAILRIPLTYCRYENRNIKFSISRPDWALILWRIMRFHKQTYYYNIEYSINVIT